MPNIGKIMGLLEKVAGTQGQLTIKNKTVLKALAKEAGISEKASKEIFSIFKHPQIDLAYSAGKTGSASVSAVIRDGKAYIGDASAAIKGLGTENAVIKGGMNIGEGGKYLHYKGAWDFSKPANIQDMAVTLNIKDGIIKSTGKLGQFSKAEASLDIRNSIKKLEELAPKNEKAKMLADGITYDGMVQKFNDLINKVSIKPLRELLAGKEVNFAEAVASIKPKVNNSDLDKLVKNINKLNSTGKLTNDMHNYLKTLSNQDLEYVAKHVDKEKFEKLLGKEQLTKKLSIIMDGPAGTGKTSVSECFSKITGTPPKAEVLAKKQIEKYLSEDINGTRIDVKKYLDELG